MAKKKDMLVIPHKHLAKYAKTEVKAILTQKLAKVGGAIFYPGFAVPQAILTHDPSALSLIAISPVCISVHSLTDKEIGTGFLESIEKNSLVKEKYRKPEHDIGKIRKRFTHAFISPTGNLVFVNEPKQSFLKKWFGSTRYPLDYAGEKPNLLKKLMARLEPSNKKIIYQHLSAPLKKGVNQILKARRIRAKVSLAAAASGVIFGSIFGPGGSLVGGASLGGGSYLGFSKYCSQKVSRLAEIASSFELVSPKHKKKYNEKKLRAEHPFFFVNTTGDIHFLKLKKTVTRKKIKTPTRVKKPVPV